MRKTRAEFVRLGFKQVLGDMENCHIQIHDVFNSNNGRSERTGSKMEVNVQSATVSKSTPCNTDSRICQC